MPLPTMSFSDLSLSGRASTLDPTTRGVIAMVVGMGFQVANDTVVKLASARLPAHEIMGLRGLMAIALTFLVICVLGQRDRLKLVASPTVMLRSALEAAACFTYMSALAHLGLAEFTSIMQATPLIMTALAVMLGWQKVGWRRWLAVAVGFGGVLLIARPSTQGVNAYAALALLSAAIVAVRDLVTRRMPQDATSFVVTLGATIAVTTVGFGLGAAQPETWVMPGPGDLVFLAVAACLVVLCNMTIVLAFRSGDMAVVGPFRYSVILGSLVLGALVWGDRPDALALAGSALIVASGLYALKRERSRHEPATVAAPTPLA
ncbi:DMT family transporter [Hansschlegelia sp. KR7-227]|uniref:DMT family transporter n=1 Tax=Hansschlegelia sp. KR7-227 TaxID=3400914 RepID=UPI003C0FFD38